MIFLTTIHVPFALAGRKYDMRDHKILTMWPDLRLPSSLFFLFLFFFYTLVALPFSQREPLRWSWVPVSVRERAKVTSLEEISHLGAAGPLATPYTFIIV